MNSLSYPVCALFIAILVNIVFFSKQRVDTEETKIYKNLIIINLLECIFAVVGLILINSVGDNIFMEIVVKVDYALMILWATTFAKYVFSIGIINSKTKKIMNYFSTIFSSLITLLILILPVEIIINDGMVDSKGLSTITVFAAAIIYIILITIFSFNILFNKQLKNNKRKILPLFFLILLAILLVIMKTFASEIIIQNFVFSFVSLIMYFTIENPDVKMLEQIEFAKDRAEKANAAKTDFLSSMSHEIRTPLNAIVGFSEAIGEEGDLESAKNDAKDIVLAANNLLEIVNGILDISKIEANKMEIVEKEYNPTELFESIAKLTAPRIGDKPIELKVNIAKDLPESLYGDSGKLKQITTNILTNAVKYTEEGTINYNVSCVNLNNESSLVISVEDTGRGIKPEQIDKLFTKFERLEEDRNTTLEGTGLGLAITKKLVEMMGGKVVVQSVYGSGSKFTVYLKQKINHNPLQKVKEEPQKLITDFTGKKVLVVDDSNVNLKVAERLLKKYKLDIATAESGFECINKINAKENYDLILLDDMMPKMRGTETLKKLKLDDRFNVPVVILTANAIDGMKNKYLDAGFDDYLSKPIEKQELERVLNKFLNKVQTPNKEPETKIEITKTKVEIIDNENETRKIIEETKVEGITPEQLEQSKAKEESVNMNTKEYLISNNIDVEHGLELLGDIDMYNSIMEDFVNEIGERLPKLKEYKDALDMPNYAIIVHAIKSDCKYLGIMDLAEHNYQHELKSKANDVEFVKSDYDNLIKDINKYLQICKNYLNK